MEFPYTTVETRETEPQKIFGLLARLAMENGIETFHSDLYHDAIWLRENLDKARSRKGLEGPGFFWSCRASGTALNEDSARNVTSGGTGERVFFISLSRSVDENTRAS